MGFFQRMLQRFQRFMYGRYGGDVLNLVILTAAVIWSMGWRYTKLWPVAYLSWVLTGWAVFRMFSRNLTRRRAENERFLRIVRPVGNWFRNLSARLKDKDHKRFTCPKCKQVCRVPRGKGKIRIVCPRCGTGFVRKT